jgi:hypothetical protein
MLGKKCIPIKCIKYNFDLNVQICRGFCLKNVQFLKLGNAAGFDCKNF